MIADKKMDGYFGVGDLGQLAQQSHIALWYNPPVFIPEIKNVSDNKNLSSVFFYFIQELNNYFFALKAGLVVRSTEMKIGKEIDFFIGRDMHSFILLLKILNHVA